MEVLKTARVALAAGVCLAGAARFASAEIVYMSSGGTFSVKNHTTDGETVTLTLRAGGQVTCDKTLIARIVPDEVPHPEPPAPSAQAPSARETAAERRAQLRETAYASLISATAEAYGVDPILVQALIQVESNYQPRARSSKGAMGLMQLMPSVAREYKVRNAYDPAANIDAGVRKLRSLIDTWGIEMALAAYNAGEGAVARFNGIPPYRETQNYVSRIMALVSGR